MWRGESHTGRTVCPIWPEQRLRSGTILSWPSGPVFSCPFPGLRVGTTLAQTSLPSAQAPDGQLSRLRCLQRRVPAHALCWASEARSTWELHGSQGRSSEHSLPIDQETKSWEVLAYSGSFWSNSAGDPAAAACCRFSSGTLGTIFPIHGPLLLRWRTVQNSQSSW